MLELIGFLSVMTLWWGISLSTFILAISPLVEDYLTRIGLPEKWKTYKQKVVGPLFFTKSSSVNEVCSDKYTDKLNGWKFAGFLIGCVLWIISLMSFFKLDHLWTISVRVSELLAPNVWWISLLFVYPTLVKVGRFFVVANKFVSSQK